MFGASLPTVAIDIPVASTVITFPLNFVIFLISSGDFVVFTINKPFSLSPFVIGRVKI